MLQQLFLIPARGWSVLCLILCPILVGCGTTNSRSATEQLLMSDAVDQVIGQINFAPLTGQTVFLDTSYIVPVKTAGFVNSPYVVSSLRQQLTAAGCLLQETKDAAEIIVEPRIGTLGTDGHEITFGIPASQTLSSAASIVSNTPGIPIIPEISLAKSDSHSGAAKVSVFAYYRESRQPIWQSGTLVAESTAKDTWFLGAGPLQTGSIHDGVQFAGHRLGWRWKNSDPTVERSRPQIEYNDEIVFSKPRSVELNSIVPASFQDIPAEESAKPSN
ncbi:MAG: DUF6655 family protein [Planctomycetota bacterium]|nr:DUF6655 family protein [Planctomycetota bacterium]